MKIVKNEKRFFIVFAILSLVIFSFLIIHFLWMLPANQSLYSCLLLGILLLFTVLIVSSWKAFGLIGGLFSCIISSFVALVVSIGSKNYFFNLLVPLYICMDAAGYVFFRKEKSIAQMNRIAGEEIEESFNSLFAENKKHLLLTEALNKKYYRYLNLKSVVELLSSSLSLAEIIRLAAGKTLELVGKSDFCLFYLVDEEEQKLSLAAFESQAESASKIKSKNGDVFDNWVLKQRQPLMIHDSTKDYRFGTQAEAEERNFRSIISAPLMTEGKVIGILRLENSQTNVYVQDDLRLLNIIASLSAVAVENAILFQRTVELAITDGLTGLHVQHYFKERFTEELHRSARNKSCLSLLMCDIDNFKKYNDKYGHAAGDIVLKTIAGILKNSAKPGDFAARYGGEEFAVFLPGQNKKTALEMAEKIRNAVRQQDFILRRKKSRVAISIGLSAFPEDGVIAETLIKEADQALYKAKEEGRDRVCSA